GALDRNLGARARHVVDWDRRTGVVSRCDSDRDDFNHFGCGDRGPDGPAVNKSLLANELGLVPHHAGSRLAAPANSFPASARPSQAGPLICPVDGAAVPACGTDILVPACAPKPQPETTGRIQTSRHRWRRAGVMI